MDPFRAIEISACGMSVQQARIEAAVSNLANAHSAYTATGPNYQPVVAAIRSIRPAFEPLLGAGAEPLTVPQARLVAQSGPGSREAFEPGNPDADAAGMVRYPAVDHTREMMTVMTAMRTYEANLAALQATKAMATKALEIGGQ